MKRTNPKVILTIASIVVGVLISLLMRGNVGVYTPATNKSIEQTRDEIKVARDEIRVLNDIVKEKEQELKKLKSTVESEEEISDVLAGDLKSKKAKSGYTALEGPGISIKMYDNIDSDIIGMNVNDDVIHDVDILNILNDLKIAGAEAISINDQRVLSTSEIKCGGPIIRINGKSVGTPFIIKAIGDPQVLMASVHAPGTYGDTLKNVYFIGFEPKVEDKVIVPEYKDELMFQFAKPKGEDDI